MPLAIDFGTSNTVVARWNHTTATAETLPLPGLSLQQGDNPALVPSWAYVERPQPDQVWVGQEVPSRGLDLPNDPRFFRNFKRGIGTPMQGFLPQIEGQPLTFEQVGQWFLQRVLQQAAVAAPLDSLVLTVPVDSFETYRQWLSTLTTELAIPQVRLIDEPTAAALGYGLSQGIVLVLDFGGGTLDWSLVRLVPQERPPLGFVLRWGRKTIDPASQRPQGAKVLAKAGENLGGADIDNWLLEHFHQQHGLPLTPLALRLAERLKIQLSSQPQASMAYFDDETLDTYDLSFSQPQLADLLEQHQLFQRLERSLDQIRQQARAQGVALAQIDGVLLVGGTAQLPAIQRWVKQQFKGVPVYGDRPFEAVAHGALQLQQGLDIEDFLYHSYGVRYWDRRNNRHGWQPIIEQGQAYPMTEPVELVLGASAEQQPRIELVLGELGEAATQTEVFFEGGRLITRQVAAGNRQVQPLNDRDGGRSIAQLTPPGMPGTDRIRVLFVVDRQRQLRITVEDLLTGDTLIDNRAVVELS